MTQPINHQRGIASAGALGGPRNRVLVLTCWPDATLRETLDRMAASVGLNLGRLGDSYMDMPIQEIADLMTRGQE